MGYIVWSFLVLFNISKIQSIIIKKVNVNIFDNRNSLNLLEKNIMVSEKIIIWNINMR